MKLTNKTMQNRSVTLGIHNLVLKPLETVEIPSVQLDEFRRVIKSDYWKKLLDAQVFSIDDKTADRLDEEHATVVEKKSAPEDLKVLRGRAKVSKKVSLTDSIEV